MKTIFAKSLAAFALLLVISGCADVRGKGVRPTDEGDGLSPSESAPPPAVFPHSDDWSNPASHGAWVLQFGAPTCLECHKISSDKDEITPTCNSCHPLFPHEPDWVKKENHGGEVINNGRGSCATQCHGSDLEGGLSGISCNLCHTTYPHPPEWVSPQAHGESAKGTGRSACQSCHGTDLLGGDSGVSCKSCHTNYPHAADWDQPDQHGAFVSANGTSSCASLCHGNDLKGGLSGVGCNSCHTIYPHASTWEADHGATTLALGTSVCKPCHGDNLRALVDGKNCYSCHHDYPHTSPTTWLPFAGGHGQRVNTIYSGSTASCEPCHGADLKKIKPDGKNCFSCHPTYPHKDFSTADWGTYEGHGQYALPAAKRTECQVCHGTDYKGGTRFNPSCFSCHTTYPHLQIGWLRSPGQPQEHGKFVLAKGSSSCATSHCHGTGLVPTPDITNGPGCNSCHTTYPHAAGWISGSIHGPVALANMDVCKDCHGYGLDSGPPGHKSCLQCHPSFLRHESAELGATNWDTYVGHGAYLKPKHWDATECTACHGANYLGGVSHISCKSCHASFPHNTPGWETATGHPNYIEATLGGNLTTCKVCHGNDLKGGHSEVSCNTCHMNYPHSVISGWATTGHGSKADTPAEREPCKTCHGANFLGGTSGVSCKSCHASFPHDTPGWTGYSGHGAYVMVTLGNDKTPCKLCHGLALTGGISGVSCTSCHTNYPHPPGWSTIGHGPSADTPAERDTCKVCHGADLLGGTNGEPSCKSCHASFPHDTPGWSGYSGHGAYVMATPGGDKSACKVCHGGDLTGGKSGVSCYSCHTNYPHLAGWALPTAHGVAAYGTGKNSCASTNCHKSNFAGNPPLVPACSGCHADFPHTNPNWRNGTVGLAGNVHAATFISKISGGDTIACQGCHGASYNRSLGGSACTDCHTGGVTHRPAWATGTQHGAYFSSRYDSATTNTTCKDCHGHTDLAVAFANGQSKAGLLTQSDCYECHWSYPHMGYDVSGYDPGVPGVLDADELWSVVDDGIIWGAGDNSGHLYYLMNSPLFTDSAGYHPVGTGDPALITPSAPGVTPVIQHTCGGSTGGSCHSSGYRTTPTGSTSNLCGQYCHKP